MKKNLLLIMVTLVIVPQVAFASWWNPFTWNIFSSIFHSNKQIQIETTAQPEKTNEETSVGTSSAPRTVNAPVVDTSDMVLCNGQYYKKCLTGQLLVCPTDTKAEAYCSVPKTPKVKTVTGVTPTKAPATTTASNTSIEETKKTSVPAKDENFSEIAVSSLLSDAKSFQDLADYSNNILEYFQIITDSLDTLVAQHEGYVLGLGSQDSSISQAYIGDYKDDLLVTNGYKRIITAYRDKSKEYVVYYKALATEKSTRYVSREESITIMQASIDEKNWALLKGYIDASYEKYKIYRKNRDDMYVKNDAALRALYSRMSSAPTLSTYQPQPVPQFQVPTYTPPQSTHCTVSGDGVGIQAYVNCTTGF